MQSFSGGLNLQIIMRLLNVKFHLINSVFDIEPEILPYNLNPPSVL